MSNTKLLSLAAAAVAFVGCNNNPVTTYRIQMDQTALKNLPATCYQNSTIPVERDQNPSERAEFVWTVWSAAAGKSYLDTGAFGETGQIKMGDAAPISVTGAIESTDGKTYNGTDTKQNVPPASANSPSNYSNTEVLQLNVAFETTGGNASGTVTLSSQYQCTNCLFPNNDGQVSCGPISVTFSGASIPTTALTGYPANVNGL